MLEANLKQTSVDKERRRNILQFIADFTEVHGYPPTFREVGMGVGLSSTSSVMHQLKMLQTLGRVAWVNGSSRTLRVIPL